VNARLRACCIAAFAAAAFVAPQAKATGFHEIGQDYKPRERTEVELSGYFRTRGEALYNLDLDRGLTPSGLPVFPVSQADPKAQTLTHWDMRLRTDVALYAPGSMVGVKARFDVLDNIALGSLPAGVPSATTTQRSPGDVIRVRRAWGELLLPFGFLAAGRMGTHWGLGMVANGGDCLDCDSGDASDRVAFITPLAGHIWALAYDFSATGPVGSRALQSRTIDFERSTNVRTVTFAWMNWRSDEVRARRMKADKTTVEYGSYITHRWQSNDVPGTYLPTAQPLDPFVNGGAGIMARGFRASALDGWFRLTFPWARIEGEAAFLTRAFFSAIPRRAASSAPPCRATSARRRARSPRGSTAATRAGTPPRALACSRSPARPLRRLVIWMARRRTLAATTASTTSASTRTTASTASSFARSSARSPMPSMRALMRA
jgi:hypothetical protein